MQLSSLDISIIIASLGVSLLIGLYSYRSASKNFSSYFLGGGKMPWWLLGISMVATTFAADTPNFVTQIVRQKGVSQNWIWWAFLLTGMLTVFVYAKLWKRSGVLTDLEFYELRYSGAPAAFLRGFRAVYLGLIFNCLVMAVVIHAGIKIGGVLLGLTPLQVVLIGGVVTVFYTMLGGLRGVILTDFFQFILAIVGAVGAAIVILRMPEINGVQNLISHPNVADKINILPNLTDREVFIPLLIIPLAVQWWSSWYPGAEPGGGGYVAQRMLSAKSEADATGATLLFNVAHYALRPWPWIIVALASLIIYPNLAALQDAFPDIDQAFINDDLAYPAMLSLLPKGLIGIVIASLIAAFMSTISTHLNWGSSYISNDLYHRFMKPAATEKEVVAVGRLSTLVMMIIASLIALELGGALEGFNIILQIGAGTGLIFILRWFWWRINAYTEIAGMVISFAVALFFYVNGKLEFFEPALQLADWEKLLWGVGITTLGWLVVTFITRPTERDVLTKFYLKVKPDTYGWKPIQHTLTEKNIELHNQNVLGVGITSMLTATLLVYSLLFGVGYVIYSKFMSALIAVLIAIICSFILIRLWPKLKMDQENE